MALFCLSPRFPLGRQITAALLLVMLFISGCAVVRSPGITRIALLAPFEGRYREVGYQALYATRMAIAETERIDLDLLAVDDGGSLETALDRARALNYDPLVEGVLVLGPHASDAAVLDTLEPYTLVVGQWTLPLLDIEDETIAPPTELTAIAALDVNYVCADMCLLESFALLADDPTLATIVVSSPPVTADFRERYVNFDLYVPEPLPFAQQTYEATQYMLAIVEGEISSTESPPPFTDAEWTYRYTAEGELVVP